MLFDTYNTFAAGVSTGNTGTRILGDVIDLSNEVNRDIGAGETVFLRVQVSTAIAAGAGGTYQIKLTSADNEALSTNAVDHIVTGTFDAAAGIDKGTILVNIALPSEDYKRYLGVQEVVGTANTTAGAVYAFLSLDQLAYKSYPSAE